MGQSGNIPTDVIVVLRAEGSLDAACALAIEALQLWRAALLYGVFEFAFLAVENVMVEHVLVCGAAVRFVKMDLLVCNVWW